MVGGKNMQITNEKYVSCPICKAEGYGLEQINKKFGYYLKGDDVVPYRHCRECRRKEEEENQPQNEKNEQQISWASASTWGKKIHINRRTFDSYLIDLGYLEKDPNAVGRRQKVRISRMGDQHSALTNNPFKRIILWDYDTFVKVMKLRAEKATVHYCCEKCGTPIDDSHVFDYLESEYQCNQCGHIGEVFHTEVIFDR